MAASAAGTTASNIPYPNAFKTIKMSNGTRRLVLNSETSLIDDCYEVEETTPINAANQNFLVNLPMGNANASLNDVLALRATGMSMSVDAPDPNQPLPGEAPISSGENGVPKFTFFIYDHLGNSRILYSNVLKDCLQDSTKYILEHVLDYYPYGKTLREYVFVREKHQTTYHERDEETGLDYRGARFYDAEVGRFLSCDPLAAEYAAWSTYNYVLGNPIKYVDPSGKNAETTQSDPPGGNPYAWLASQFRSLGNHTMTETEEPRRRCSLAANGFLNLNFGAVGTVGAAMTIPETGGWSAAAIPSTITEIGLGATQMGDALFGPADPQSPLHQAGSLIGYAAYSAGNDNAEVIDALGQALPGLATGGNIKGLFSSGSDVLTAIHARKYGTAAMSTMETMDAWQDSKAEIKVVAAMIPSASNSQTKPVVTEQMVTAKRQPFKPMQQIGKASMLSGGTLSTNEANALRNYINGQ